MLPFKEIIIAIIACVLQPSYSVYEKAIYAALSGDIKHVSVMWLVHDKLLLVHYSPPPYSLPLGAFILFLFVDIAAASLSVLV